MFAFFIADDSTLLNAVNADMDWLSFLKRSLLGSLVDISYDFLYLVGL